MDSRTVYLDGMVIRRARQAQWLKQKELARLGGVTSRAVRHAEHGSASPQLILKLAHLVGLMPWEVVKRIRKPRCDKGKRRRHLRAIEEELAGIAASVPPEEWEKAADEIAIRRRLDEPSVPWAEVKAALGPCD